MYLPSLIAGAYPSPRCSGRLGAPKEAIRQYSQLFQQHGVEGMEVRVGAYSLDIPWVRLRRCASHALPHLFMDSHTCTCCQCASRARRGASSVSAAASSDAITARCAALLRTRTHAPTPPHHPHAQACTKHNEHQQPASRLIMAVLESLADLAG